MTLTPRQQLHRTLVKAGYRQDRKTTNALRYTGTISAGRFNVSVAWIFNDLEFTKFPTLEILSEEEWLANVVAHRSRDDFCYAQPGSQVLDQYEVPRTVLMCINRAKTALYDVLHRKDHAAEIAAEFSQHWLADYWIQADLRNKAAGEAWVDKLNFGYCLRDFKIAGQEPQLWSKAWLERSENPLTFNRGIAAPENLREFLDWADTVKAGLSDKFIKSLVKGFPKSIPALFVQGPNATVGVTLDVPRVFEQAVQRATNFERLIRTRGRTMNVVRYATDKADPDFLYSRNLGANPFANKKIALLGCGTIGSHLAKFLAQSGAGSGYGILNLVDNQTLTTANLGRHYLGPEALNRNKAEALRDILIRYPGLKVRAEAARIEDVLQHLMGYDLIVDATGDEGLAISINKHFVERRYSHVNAPSVLHVWLDGRGEAAQALMVAAKGDACFKCLRPDLQHPSFFSPLKKGYVPDRVAATCGDGAYMPYGVGASATAAGLAFTMITDFLTGNGRPYLRTVLLSAEHTKQVKDQNPERRTQCPACAKF